MAHEDQYTPEQIREALARSLVLMEPHQAAAAELLLEYSNGRIVEEPQWLRQFVAMGKSGRKASLRWERLARALSNDEDTPAEWVEAVRPYSDTERSVMRFAADLGSERWMVSRWGRSTCAQVTAALAQALDSSASSPTGGGVTNYIGGIGGSAVSGSVIQAGNLNNINWL